MGVVGILGAKYKTIVVTALIVAGSVAGATAVRAQTISLPAIDVVSSRLQPTVPGAPAASQADLGIVGASTTIISREDIERAPEQTIKDILGREAGVQTSSLYGAVNGNGTTVDVRGFGVTGPSNTLILINGRRLNDWDLPGFDLSTIDRQSIERIEITRGNSGAVLYGDGAVGGVINIVTRTGVGQPPSALFEAGYGSYNTRLGTAAVSTSSGPYSAAFYGNLLDSDGYRMNNALRQGTAVGDLRYTTALATAYLNIAGDEQSLGFPGPRRIDISSGLNQYVTDPRGTDTPRDYGDTQGWRVTAGVTRQLGNGIELILDGGFREKLQQAGFFQPFSEAYVDTTLTTASLTPRVNIRNQLFGMSNAVIAGIDLYRTDYHSDRSFAKGLPVIHQYTGRQDMFAVYGQQTLGVLPTTDVSFGARVQWNDTSVRDVYNPNAPQNSTFPQGGPLDQPEWNYAAHVGVEHRLDGGFTLFGRVARSFRVPNVDERIGNGALVFPLQPPTFDLKTQTSHDVEAGIKADLGKVTVQTSIYQMDLENELHLNPVNFANSNLDPTRRRGVETIVDRQACRQPAAQGQSHVHGRALPRGTVRRQVRSGGLAMDRQRHAVLGHPAQATGCRLRPALRQRPLPRQRRVQSRHLQDPRAHAGRCANRRRVQEPGLVARRGEPVQREIFRLWPRYQLHVPRHDVPVLQRLSAAGSHRHGQDRPEAAVMASALTADASQNGCHITGTTS